MFVILVYMYLQASYYGLRKPKSGMAYMRTRRWAVNHERRLYLPGGYQTQLFFRKMAGCHPGFHTGAHASSSDSPSASKSELRPISNRWR